MYEDDIDVGDDDDNNDDDNVDNGDEDDEIPALSGGDDTVKSEETTEKTRVVPSPTHPDEDEFSLIEEYSMFHCDRQKYVCFTYAYLRVLSYGR